MITMSETYDLISAGMPPSEATTVDRDDAIRLIREGLRKRSGKAWSVTGGRGTGWGWITITAPPARREPADAPKEERWYMSDADQAELATLLGVDYVHKQGQTIPAASDYRRVWIERALGLEVISSATQYWD